MKKRMIPILKQALRSARALRKTMWTLCVLLMNGNVMAQWLTPNVLSTAGNYFENTAISISYTVGEMTAVTSLTSSVVVLTQGFQQPADKTTGIAPSKRDSGVYLRIFPNPASNYITLECYAGQSDIRVEATLYNLLGAEMMRENYYPDEQAGRVKYIDLSHLPDGVYLISIRFITDDGIKKQYTSRLTIQK